MPSPEIQELLQLYHTVADPFLFTNFSIFLIAFQLMAELWILTALLIRLTDKVGR